MASNWISNFAGVNHMTYIPMESTNIDDLFQKQKEGDENIIKMIELKEVLLDLIQGKEEIDITEEEKKEIENGGKENEKMNKTVETIKTLIQEFTQVQDNLNKINERFQTELKLLQQNISTIENMISFLQKLPKEHRDETIMKRIIDSMNELSQKILKNEKIQGIKKEYIQERKVMEKYIHFIKKLNNFNQFNICPLCFTKPVDHFIDPCGHTFCKDCIQSLKTNPNLDLYEIGRNDNSQCCYCREKIKTIRPLYFL